MKIRLLTVAIATSACAIPNAPERPQLTVEVPERWLAPAQEGAQSDEAWWLAFDDPGMTLVIEEALQANRDLRSALHRVEAAGAIARAAGADRLPQATIGGSAQRNQQVFVGLPIPGGGDVLVNTVTAYGVSLDVSWEMDFWGRLRSRVEAADADYRASAEEFEAARHSLAAQVAKTYLAWQEAQLQVSLAERAVESFEGSANIARSRFESGLTSALDVRLSDSDASGARALKEQRREQLERTVRQLEILLGRYPSGKLSAEAKLPDLPAPPPAGLPSEILLARPDLRAADARLAATHARLYEARAAFYPSIALTGSFGRTSTELGDLLDSNFDFWSIAAGLVQPLFQGGRLEAGAELAQAQMREAVEAYASAVLRAFSEVEQVLAVEDALEARQGHRTRAFEDASAASELAGERYASGLEDLNALLTAQRRALDAETGLLSVRRERLAARVDLFLALGGSLATESATSTPEQQRAAGGQGQ